MAAIDTTSAIAPQKRRGIRKSITHLSSPDVSGSFFDQENRGADLTTALDMRSSTTNFMAGSKRSRSKSIGPGGLDALRGDAGNRRKAAAVAPKKSILKPSIPLSPLKEIPVRKFVGTVEKADSPSKTSTQTTLSPKKPTKSSIPIVVPNKAVSPKKTLSASPAKSPAKSPKAAPPQHSIEDELLNLDDGQEERRKARDEIMKQRELRRKSMANRRVSFAPEATLHRWDEEMEECTTSSASTNSTRRTFGMTNGTINSPHPGRPATTTPDDEDPPSTAASQIEDIVIPESQERQRYLHQKKRRRRSSGIPPMNFNNPEDSLSSSPESGGPEAGDITVTPDMILRAEMGAPPVPVSRNGSPIKLAHPVGCSGGMIKDNGVLDLDIDDLGEATMDIVDEEITAAFKPWAQQMLKAGRPAPILSRTMENVNPFSPAFKQSLHGFRNGSPAPSVHDEGDMSMDITRAVGSIVPTSMGQTRRGKSAPRRQSIRSRRRSSAESAYSTESTMEFTTAIGGIQQGQTETVDDSRVDSNENLSMEFTSVFGGIKQMNNDEDPIEEEADMEMTTSLGNIVNKPTESMQEDENLDMDTTGAVSVIIPQQRFQSVSGPATPSSAQRSRGRPRKNADTSRSTTPTEKPHTPSKSVTPKALRPVTPAKTSQMRAVSPAATSARVLFQNELRPAEVDADTTTIELFHRDPATGQHNPPVVFAAKAVNRRVSGVGFDKEGLGSPRVAMLLDTRTSLGEKGDVFVPTPVTTRGIRFENPKLLAIDLFKAREDDERRESGRFILENEAEADREGNATMTLKEAIISMTPKKKSLKGRKSLAPGGAKGLLGTRPAELDESDNDGTPRALKGRQPSSAKQVKLLPASSLSANRTTLGETVANGLPRTPSLQTPTKGKSMTTPKSQGRFKNADVLPSAQKPLPTFGQGSNEEYVDIEEGEERIHLQDFLNLTSIRFIELNTTKRRHTLAPAMENDKNGSAENVNGDGTDPFEVFENSVVAGTCTIPMLELYQHSCRELKKYIAEGRGVIREIEAETFQENPPLFQEYMSASPADRALMDNQFKNMKTNARLVSKGMWYEWRMKLLEGLKEGLLINAEGLESDSNTLAEEELAIEAVLPVLINGHTRLEQECEILQARADELAGYDQDELTEAREQISALDKEFQAKQQMLVQCQLDVQGLETSIEKAQDSKVECLHSIREAQRLLEEYRGWSEAEVGNLKAKVDAMEAKHGWSLNSSAGSTITMTYCHQLQLFFDVSAFKSQTSSIGKANAPISLTYIGDQNEYKPSPLTTDKRFFLQLMRAHLQCLGQHQTHVQDLLAFVSAGWTTALALADEVRALDAEFITHCHILSDERLGVRATVLLPSLKTKVHVGLEIGAAAKGMALEVTMRANAEVVYGGKYNVEKMREFLAPRIGHKLRGGSDGWVCAVRELRKRLFSTGKRI